MVCGSARHSPGPAAAEVDGDVCDQCWPHIAAELAEGTGAEIDERIPA